MFSEIPIKFPNKFYSYTKRQNPRIANTILIRALTVPSFKRTKIYNNEDSELFAKEWKNRSVKLTREPRSSLQFSSIQLLSRV